MNLREYLPYDYSIVSDHTVTGDVYEQVASLITEERPTGWYELKISMSHTLDSLSSGAFFRYSVDGGTTWTEYNRSAQVNNGILLDTFIELINHTTGIFEISVEARKETATDTLIIKKINLILERKL